MTPGPYDDWQILPVVPGFREPQILGGGRGRQCWTFEAIASGRTTISMSLRGGDITSPPSDTAQITVIVLQPGAPAQVPWP